MKKAPLIARIFLGLIFFVFGLKGFLSFIPQPPPPPAAGAFAAALFATGYFFPLLKGIEVVCGALLLSGRFVPLALTVLAPIVVNIFAFHAVLAPAGLPIAVAILALEAYLGYAYRGVFRPMLQSQVAPSESPAPLAAGRASEIAG